jgi:hypothetical protein
MIKVILMILVVGFSIYALYKAIAGKATGPYTKELELLWNGEECGAFGKVILIGVPVVLLVLINSLL